jgi:hypothetical protein
MKGDATEIGAISPFFIVADVGRSRGFYAELGFADRFSEPPDAPFFAIVGRGGAQIFLKQEADVAARPNRSRSRTIPWDAFVLAPDPDRLAAEFEGAGLALHRPLIDRPDGLRGFEIADPDGYVIFFGRP